MRRKPLELKAGALSVRIFTEKVIVTTRDSHGDRWTETELSPRQARRVGLKLTQMAEFLEERGK
jgi:hypothetical protein